jgi:CubicO group peptidase (beta-lactamase class C family)
MRWLLFLLTFSAPAEVRWPTASAASQGLSQTALEALARDLAAQNTKSLLVARRGRLVYEWYAPEHGPEQRHYTASLAKALIGGTSLMLAVAGGKLRIDDPAHKYIPRWKDDPVRSRITIRHLATHSSGLKDANQEGVPHEKLPGWMGAFWRREPSPFLTALSDAPVQYPPGARYSYSNPGMAALAYAVAASLRNSAEPDVRRMLIERVMRPLGIPDGEWSMSYGQSFPIDGMTVYANWGGGSFTARAAARVGQWMLQRGSWNGVSLAAGGLTTRFVSYAGTPVPDRAKDKYAPASGLAWYTNYDRVWSMAPSDAFAGAGAGHQLLIVIPSLELVAVRNGGALSGASFWTAAYESFFAPLMQAIRTTPPPYPPSRVVSEVRWAPPESVLRAAIDSDNWPMTWGDDDAIYTSYGDGFGFAPGAGVKLSLGFARITGPPESYQAANTRSPSGERKGDGERGLKSSGMLMADGVLYMWVRNAKNAQLAWSEDRGATWQWGFRFEESFGSPSFLNFGKNYEGARDGFVYAYSQDGPSAYKPDDGIILARAPRNRLRDRSAWELFAGMSGGRPSWTKEIAGREPAFEYPGRCERTDAVYHPVLKRYLLTVSYNHEGGWGIYEAPEPWGPWSTMFHTDDWGLGPTHGYRLPAKWFSADGKTIWLVFSGRRGPGMHYDAFCTRKAELIPR